MKIAILLLFVTAANAELMDVGYSTEFCKCSGKIDTAQITVKEFEGAKGLLYEEWRHTRPYVEKTDSKDTLAKKLKATNEVNEDIIKALKSYSFPKGSLWEAHRQTILYDNEVEHYIETSEIEYLISEDTNKLKALFRGKPLPDECLKFADALGDLNKLGLVAEKFGKEECKKNADFKVCMEHYTLNPANPLSVADVRHSILSFGWHNCVNKQRKHMPRQEPHLHKAFAAFIKDKKCDCEETD